jgi:hypothetical protein
MGTLTIRELSVQCSNNIFAKNILTQENEVVGAEIRDFKSNNTRYQCLVKETEKNKNIADGWYIGEDAGHIFIYFRTLQQLENYFNINN